MIRLYRLVFLLLVAGEAMAQSVPGVSLADTTWIKVLEELSVRGSRMTATPSLAPIHNGYLIAGKRSEQISLSGLDANLTEKNARQVFARIPGLFVYDMDGSGNQLNIATRGLDPHRSWEFNLRQNGVLTNSDMYGYPASHYSPPMESLERIEIVRGTAALQYGAQFGGMINFVTKKADTTRGFGFESINAVGSFGLRSTYNAVGGRVGKLTYYAYAYWRHSDGYRQNGRSDAQAQFASLQYVLSPKFTLQAEVGRSAYRYRIPGPLTDSMFRADPRQATRSRNYFNPDIWVPSLRLNGRLSARTELWITLSAVLGARNSVLFDAFATVDDGIDPATGRQKSRQVDIDRFNSYTAEMRLLHRYKLAGRNAALVVGFQGMNNDLHRRQLGRGTSGTDFDLSISPEGWGRDLHYRTGNLAFFAENQWYVTPRLTLSPGIRVENGLTRMRGIIRYYAPEGVPNDIGHRFALLGVNAEYRLRPSVRLYAGWSQAYRPVIFKDIIPASVYERTDNSLKNAHGYNAEIGLEGNWKGIHMSVSVFDLLYRNRLGNIVTTESDGTSLILRTNIGASRSRGVEALLEAELLHTRRLRISAFSSTAYLNARYRRAEVADGGRNASVDGNRIEAVPEWISRNGITIRLRSFSLTTQFSYVGMTYSDALNTATPKPNGAKGPVPAYGLWDANATWRMARRWTVRGSLNNALNKSYFTKRPTFYPGPGVWPSDGRSAVVSVGMTL